jgi:secretion/DNA translocation related TadE-like protein
VSQHDERGAATLLVLAMAGILVFLAVALVEVAAAFVAHRSAQSAADLAALAGARGLVEGRDGCATAAEIAAANHAHVTSCLVSGSAVEVAVEVAGPRWLGRPTSLVGRARAGPAP